MGVVDIHPSLQSIRSTEHRVRGLFQGFSPDPFGVGIVPLTSDSPISPNLLVSGELLT